MDLSTDEYVTRGDARKHRLIAAVDMMAYAVEHDRSLLDGVDVKQLTRLRNSMSEYLNKKPKLDDLIPAENSEEAVMTFQDVTQGGGRADFLSLAPGQSAKVHILFDETSEPKSFKSVFFESIQRSAIVDPDNNPVDGLEDGFEVRKRHAFNVVDLADNKIKVLECSNALAGLIKGIYEEYQSFEEIDLKITRRGDGLQTKYEVIVIPMSFTPDVIEGQEKYDLEALYPVTPTEEIEQMMQGIDPRGDGVEQPAAEEETPAEEVPVEEEVPAEEVPVEEEVPLAPAPKKVPPKPAPKLPPKGVPAKVAPKAAPAKAPAAAPLNRVALMNTVKANFTKLKRYANKANVLADVKKFGGPAMLSMSQLTTEALAKLAAFQKTQK